MTTLPLLVFLFFENSVAIAVTNPWETTSIELRGKNTLCVKLVVTRFKIFDKFEEIEEHVQRVEEELV
jgi:hypothetical protein